MPDDPADHRLPDFIEPMLARLGEPFDSDRHLFEVKWDGIRAVAFVGGGAPRILSRRRVDITERYPEIDLDGLVPPGVVLDGEIVALRDGSPDFGLVLTREQVRSSRRIRALAASTPVTYVVFDLLYEGFEPILRRPFHERRDRLAALVGACVAPWLVLSDGVVGAGRKMFEEVCERELEGVVAKRLDSVYLPGKRTDAWIKIKRTQRVHCLILGFVPKERDDFRSLVLASDVDGELRYVGRVGGGFSDAERDRLNELLRQRVRDEPLVPCDEKATWIEPGLYCTVSFLERTGSGMLRVPVFEELIVE